MNGKQPFACCIALIAFAVLACSDPTAPPESLSISDVRVEANPHNARALNVRFRATGVSGARVLYRANGAAEEATPFVELDDGEVSLPILGLLPDTEYSIVVEAAVLEAVHATEAVLSRTGAVPDAISAIALEATEGVLPNRLLLTAIDNKVVVFDGTGQVVWYREMDQDLILVDATGVGSFVAFVGQTRGFDPIFGYYQEVSPSGELLERYAANAPLYTDSHEFIMTGDPGLASTHFFSYDLRRMDMSPYGGSATARVAGHQILRFGPKGGLEFMWNAWDHFDLDEWIVAVPPRSACQVVCDFDHPNSLGFDASGNYVVSFRSLNQVVAVESRTGELLWRLGGTRSDFTFVDDPLGGFSGQHTAEAIGGNVLLFDNGPNHIPPTSRAAEYALDVVAGTARLVWSYMPSPAIYTPFQSSAQRLADGNTLVAFSQGAHVHEVSPDGSAVWKARVLEAGVPHDFYRVIEIASLYDPRRAGP